jgi:mono/diheme cytochrome c family protein
MKKILITLGFFLPVTVVGATQDVEAGRRAFNRCAACHVTPDPSLVADRKWLASINESA